MLRELGFSKYAAEKEETGQRAALKGAIAGAGAGALATIISYPLDTLSSAKQLHVWPQTWVHIKAGKGLWGKTNRLYAGMGSKLLKTVPAAAATFVGYEVIKKLLNKNNNKTK